MAKKVKPINPFIRKLMDRDGYENINQAAKGWGIHQGTLDRWADIDTEHSLFEAILINCEKMDVEPKELMKGVLSGKRKDIAS